MPPPWSYAQDMPQLSETTEAKEWLAKIEDADREIVSRWLDDLKLASADEFRRKLLALIKREAQRLSPDRPIALYAERELARRLGLTQYAFHQRPTRSADGNVRMRAYGRAAKFKLQQSPRTVRPEAGSEAIVANLLTQLQRGKSARFVLNPGPDEYRAKRISTAFIVSDFVGTGHRTYSFLDAFWRMPTVRSWRSLGLVRFHVVAFSATSRGAAHVVQHPIGADVHWVAACPTIDTCYSAFDATRLKEVLIRNDPRDHDPVDSLGYGGQGSMLVFSHGCPNNAPRLLYMGTQRRPPLFAQRSNLMEDFSEAAATPTAGKRFERLAKSAGHAARLGDAHTSIGGQERLLVLAALKAGHRLREQIAIATGLDLPNVEQALASLKSLGWVSVRNSLTDQGHRNLKAAGPFKLYEGDSKVLAARDEMYYPKLLRPPV